jgi:hypothetical protein
LATSFLCHVLTSGRKSVLCSDATAVRLLRGHYPMGKGFWKAAGYTLDERDVHFVRNPAEDI